MIKALNSFARLRNRLKRLLLDSGLHNYLIDCAHDKVSTTYNSMHSDKVNKSRHELNQFRSAVSLKVESVIKDKNINEDID